MIDPRLVFLARASARLILVEAGEVNLDNALPGMACPTCGASPCINPSFCAVCRDADQRKARGAPPHYIEASRWRGPPDHIPHNWHEPSVSIEALMVHFERARRRHGAPQPTVEALMFSLRSPGTRALAEPHTKRRLSELSDRQVIEVGDRLQKLKPEIARAWSPEEVKVLLQARTK